MTMQRLKTLSTISTKTPRMKSQYVVLKADRNFFSQMILVAESRSVDMKDVLAPTGPTAMNTGNCRWVPTKNKQGRICQGVWEKCISCRNYPNSINLYHWWDGSVTKDEWQQQNICTTAWVCLVNGTVCEWTECCLWRIPPAVHQIFWKTKPRCKHLILVFQKLWWCKQTQPFSTNPWQGNTTYSSGDNSCAVLSTRRASSICWLASGNYSDAEICCKALHASCEETCFKMITDEWVEVVELQSTQEEADAFACTACWRTGSKAVTAEYTDVMLLCIAFQKDIPRPIN